MMSGRLKLAKLRSRAAPAARPSVTSMWSLPRRPAGRPSQRPMFDAARGQDRHSVNVYPNVARPAGHAAGRAGASSARLPGCAARRTGPVLPDHGADAPSRISPPFRAPPCLVQERTRRRRARAAKVPAANRIMVEPRVRARDHEARPRGGPFTAAIGPKADLRLRTERTLEYSRSTPERSAIPMAHTGTPEKLLTSLFRAWHDADVATFGALFTADASYVTGDGRVFHRRRGNRKATQYA